MIQKLILILLIAVFSMGATPTKTEHTGKVIVYTYDYPNHVEQKIKLHDGKQEIELNLPPNHNLKSGQKIKIRGYRKQQSLDVETVADIQLLALGLIPGTSGPQKMAYVLPTYSDGVTGISVDGAKAVAVEIDSYYRQQSYGLMNFVGIKNPSLPGDVIPVKIAMTSGICDLSMIGDQTIQAARDAGYPMDSYRGWVVLMAPTPCPFSGMASEGSPFMAFTSGQYSIRVIAHEMGHGFGLYHARREDCPGCGAAGEYTDHTDLMANSAGVLNGWERWKLGWLDRTGTPTIVATTQPGTWTISALDAPPDGKPKAVRIPRSGTSAYWWITYRSCLQYNNGYCGIYVHSAEDNSIVSSLLHTWVNFNSDWTLDPGDVFSDYGNTRFFSVVSISNGEAVIKVSSTPPALGSGWAMCALQNGTCTPPAGTTQVAFGANTGFVYAVKSQPFTCNQDAFQQGDPAENIPKACYTKSGPITVVKVPNTVIISIGGVVTPPTVKAPNTVAISIGGVVTPPMVKIPNSVSILVK